MVKKQLSKLKQITDPITDLKKYSPITLSRKRPKTGLAPGSLIYTGKVYTDKVNIHVMDYTNDRIDEIDIENPEDLRQYNHPDSVTWINVQGLHDVSVISKIGELLGLHPLTLEDILDTNQRPKVEEFEDHLFICMKMINHVEAHNKVDIEQMSMVIHENFVICFQEKPGDVFDDIRTRLKNGRGRARKRGADYLAYMLMDIVIDFYYETLDQVWAKIERLEDLVVRKPERIELRDIQVVRKDLIQLRRYMYPVRDVVHNISTRNAQFFSESTLMFVRDSYDHAVQVVENLDTYREILTSVMDLYLSQLSMKMNEVMKVLTIIATIFIPLTFIAGIYGMNFESMPELGWDWAYPQGFYAMIGVVTVIMIIYMKSRKWL
ncbi:magnesium/cobalt transporter CorA [Marinoscillum furvescens]|uniref:Magnesium transport protein CorA n=1 Tax=Marinoscillum furvescens DSM 4134 TaxID=1122208 RepID=A0A3D9L375_MARFU|nr:magnesium/cobalt transporter CorA [Marinoscillum furvescens]RED98832.1 magnesium transporter [Marinoscillum furvescens DSM 4134]